MAKYWTFNWIKSGNIDIKDAIFNKHFFDTADAAAEASMAVRPYRHYLFKVKREKKIMFTFVPADISGGILNGETLRGLNIIDCLGMAHLFSKKIS